VGLGILVRMREWHWRPRIETAALVVTGALPFLILQVILNHNITGNWRVPAWQYYSNRDFPQTTMGFREFDPTLRPISKLPQKQNIFDHFVPHAVAEHQPHLVPKQWLNFRGPALLAGTMPSSLLAIFLPVGLAACRRDWRWVVAGVLPVFILLYSISVVFQVYYPIVVIPAALLLILLGMHTISGLFGRFAQTIRTALLLWAALTAIVSLPEAGRRVKDRLFEPVLIKQIDQWERNYGGPRGIVLFRYTPRRNMHEEPVYNTTTAWPDDARIIRAQDLGENSRLFEYYAKIQPDREVFFFDEITNTATRLGTVAELARRK
jgi:hypothetical protein